MCAYVEISKCQWLLPRILRQHKIFMKLHLNLNTSNNFTRFLANFQCSTDWKAKNIYFLKSSVGQKDYDFIKILAHLQQFHEIFGKLSIFDRFESKEYFVKSSVGQQDYDFIRILAQLCNGQQCDCRGILSWPRFCETHRMLYVVSLVCLRSRTLVTLFKISSDVLIPPEEVSKTNLAKL